MTAAFNHAGQVEPVVWVQNTVANPLQVLLIEGVFSRREKDGELIVVPDDGPSQKVDDLLEPFTDARVQLSFHHLPSMPIDPTRWGGGSCLWQPVGRCPFGHHEHPGRLLNFAGNGFLKKTVDGWALQGLDGATRDLGLSLLEGHYGRVAAAPMDAIEQMRDQVLQSGQALDVEGLGVRAADLKSILERVQRATNGE